MDQNKLLRANKLVKKFEDLLDKSDEDIKASEDYINQLKKEQETDDSIPEIDNKIEDLNDQIHKIEKNILDIKLTYSEYKEYEEEEDIGDEDRSYIITNKVKRLEVVDQEKEKEMKSTIKELEETSDKLSSELSELKKQKQDLLSRNKNKIDQERIKILNIKQNKDYLRTNKDLAIKHKNWVLSRDYSDLLYSLRTYYSREDITILSITDNEIRLKLYEDEQCDADDYKDNLKVTEDCENLIQTLRSMPENYTLNGLKTLNKDLSIKEIADNVESELKPIYSDDVDEDDYDSADEDQIEKYDISHIFTITRRV